MAFIKAHGLQIATNGYIKNAVIERLSSAQEATLAAALTEAGRIFYSEADDCYKVTRDKSGGGYEIISLMGSTTGAGEIDALKTALGAMISSGAAYVPHTGTNYINGNTTVTGDLLDLDSAIKAVSDASGDAQSELDTLETTIGAVVNAAGEYVPHTGTNYLNGNVTITQDLLDLDAQIKAVADAAGGDLGDLQTEVDAIETSVGLAADGTFVAYESTNYINGALSIKGADVLLDTKLKSTSDIADAALPRAGGTMTGGIDMGGQTIINIADSSVSNSVPSKSYVDAVATGLKIRPAVKAATTVAGGNVTLSGEQTIDEIALVDGDRVLVKNQTNAAENGVYVVASGAWSRAADVLTTGAMYYVEGRAGDLENINGNTGWALVTAAPITVGTTELSFTQYSYAGYIQDGVGIKRDGNVLYIGLGAGINNSTVPLSW